MIELLSLYQIGKPSLTNFLIEKLLLPFEVVGVVDFGMIREKFARLFQNLFEFLETVTCSDSLHDS
jgi:hypothetical protein